MGQSTITPARISEVLSGVPTGLFIGGAWHNGGATLPVEDPSNGETLAQVADATPAQGMAALDAAVSAQQQWAATDPRVRGEVLRKAFELLIARADDFALLMTLEMGKPLAEARGEVTYGAEFFRWFSEEAVRINGRYSVAPSGGTRLLTMKQPVGPVYAITPWNFPLAMGTRKIGPALAAGCTVVIKPAAQTPLTTLALAQVLTEAGLPDGVLNVVTTSHSGALSEPIIRDPRLRKLTFTGSTPVGQALIEQSAQQVLKVSMELGGNAPFLVFADADLDRAVDGAMLAKMRNIGEACTAANRFVVHESVAQEFSERLAQRMGAMVVGPGIDDGVQVGPLVDAAAVQKVSELVADALDRGAQVLTGAKTVGERGHFYAPTVLTQVPSDADMFRQEIFGPVAPITTFGTDDEGIALANDTEYGLVAYAFTENLTRALTVAERLETGMVGINQGIVSNPAAPFGGVKASGVGREGGSEGIEEYLETKYVGIAPVTGPRILVVGAGATGGYFGGRLAQAGRDVTFLLRPARAAAIRADGLQIVSEHGDMTLTPEVVEVGTLDRTYDLILLCIKAFALDQAMVDLAPAVGPETLILPLLNGMRHVDLLVDRFGRHAVLGGVCVVSATLDDRGRVVQLATMQDLAYGALDPGAPSARLREVGDALQDAGFTAKRSESIVAGMWQKWVMLASAGALGVLLRGTVGEIVAVPGGVDIAREMVAETTAIAHAAGHPLTAGAWRRVADMLTAPGSSFTTSMYRDLLAGQPVESDAIIADMVSRAEELGVATPLLRLAAAQLAIYQNRLPAERAS